MVMYTSIDIGSKRGVRSTNGKKRRYHACMLARAWLCSESGGEPKKQKHQARSLQIERQTPPPQLFLFSVSVSAPLWAQPM